jgi:putative ABC transport system ATP-binding protein
MAQDHSGNQSNLFQAVIGHLGLLFRLERRVLGLIVSYSIAIGLFALIVPLTVQELVNTFAFALQPITIVTLAAVMVAALLFVGAFRALQYYAVEVLERRIFARVAIAMAQQLPHLRYQGFKPRFANFFVETILMQRAVSVLLVDLINVIVGGAVGMTILVFYHPYFLLYNAILLVGFNVVFFLMSHGGLKADMNLSHAKYDTLHWFQEIAYNLLHFKSTDSQALLVKKTDQLVDTYVGVRRTRFGILIRQYLGSLGWQAIAHSGLIATAGWLLGIGQLTLGQFVAAEVVVSGILSSFDGVVKRMGHIYYFLTALTELNFLFSLPKDQDTATLSIPLPDPTVHGIRVTCKDLTFAPAGGPAVFEQFNLEVTPGEKVGIYADQHDGQNDAGPNPGRSRIADLRRDPLQRRRPPAPQPGLCQPVQRIHPGLTTCRCSKARSKRTSCSDGSISPTAMCDGRYASPSWKRKSMPCRKASKPTSGLPEKFLRRRTLRASWSPERSWGGRNSSFSRGSFTTCIPRCARRFSVVCAAKKSPGR